MGHLNYFMARTKIFCALRTHDEVFLVVDGSPARNWKGAGGGMGGKRWKVESRQVEEKASKKIGSFACQVVPTPKSDGT